MLRGNFRGPQRYNGAGSFPERMKRMKRMKSAARKRVCSAVFITLVFFVTAGDSQGFTLDKVLATVDKEAVTLSDYLVFADSMGIEAHADTVDEHLLRKLVEEKVMLAEAKKRGVEVSDAEVDKMIEEVRAENSLSRDDFEKELAREGMNLGRYRKLMRDRSTVLKLIGTDVDAKVMVREKDIAEFYRANMKNYLVSPARVEVRAIFLRLDPGATVTEITDLKRKALKIASDLKEGAPFKSLAARYGDERLSDTEGRPGVFERGALIPELDKKAFSMTKGEISDPIWVREGAYILKLAGKTEDIYKPIAEAREEIQKRLYARQKEKLFNDWMRTLWEKSSIVIN